MNKDNIWEKLREVKMPDDMRDRIEENNLQRLRMLYNEKEKVSLVGFRLVNRAACLTMLIVLLVLITCGGVVYAYVLDKKNVEIQPNYIDSSGCLISDTISDRYNVIKYNGSDYLAQGLQVYKEQIGNRLDTVKAYMYDETKEQMYTKSIQIYSYIGDRDGVNIIADFEGEYYLYTISTVTQEQIEEVETKLLRHFEKMSGSVVYEGCLNHYFTKVIQLPAKERINCYVAYQILYRKVEEEREFLDVNIEIIGITSNGKEIEFKNLYLNGKNTEAGIYKVLGIGIDEYFVGLEWDESGVVKATGTVANYNYK